MVRHSRVAVFAGPNWLAGEGVVRGAPPAGARRRSETRRLATAARGPEKSAATLAPGGHDGGLKPPHDCLKASSQGHPRSHGVLGVIGPSGVIQPRCGPSALSHTPSTPVTSPPAWRQLPASAQPPCSQTHLLPNRQSQPGLARLAGATRPRAAAGRGRRLPVARAAYMSPARVPADAPGCPPRQQANRPAPWAK